MPTGIHGMMHSNTNNKKGENQNAKQVCMQPIPSNAGMHSGR